MKNKGTNLPKSNKIAWTNKMQDACMYIKCESLKIQSFELIQITNDVIRSCGTS